MNPVIKQDNSNCRDISATEFKKAFGQTLDRVIKGQCIRITKHGRTGERIVMIREADLNKLEARVVSPLDALRAEFNQMVESMQSPAARKAAANVGTASTDELGEAAVKGFTAGG